MQTLTCPPGKAFNQATLKCENASTFICHWNGVEVVNLDKANVNLSNPETAIKPVIENVVPRVIIAFAKSLPHFLTPLQVRIFPYVHKVLHREFQTFQDYVNEISKKMSEAITLSNKYSNTTHYAFISVNGLFDPASEGMKKMISLGEYITNYLIVPVKSSEDQHPRSKRSPEMPENAYSLVRPFLNGFFQELTYAFMGDSESFMTKVIMPTVYEMISEPESRYDLLGLWISVKASYAPLGWEMMKRQTYNTPEGTIIKIPRSIVDNANAMFYNHSMPVIYKLLGRHLGAFLHRAGDNVPTLIKNMKQLGKVKEPYAGVLNDAILNFIVKHGQLLQNSTSSHINFHTLTEIMNDLMPIKIVLFQVLKDFYSLGENNFLDKYIGEGSLLHKQLSEIPVYAKPKIKQV